MVNAAAMGVCQACGAAAPTCPVTFRQNIGAVVMRFQRDVKGELCTDCVDRYFWKMTGTTFAVGWLGIVSIIVTPFFLALNIRDFMSARGKFRAAGVGLDSRLALAALLVGLISLFVCSPLLLPALIAIVLGFVAIIRAWREPETYGGKVPAFLGVAAGAASLLLMAIVVGLFLWSESDLSAPGERALRDADWKVNQASGEEALGNTTAAQAMAAEMNGFCKNVGQLVGKLEAQAPSSGDTPCVTYVEAGVDKVCFLVHVPDLRRFPKETVASAADLFWQKARLAATKTYGRDGVRVAVGLRGTVLYGGVAVGVTGGEKPTLVETSSAAYPPLLRECFAPPVSSQAPARPAARPR